MSKRRILRKRGRDACHHGHWKNVSDGPGRKWYCSSCGTFFEEWDSRPAWNFCPECGEDMRPTRWIPVTRRLPDFDEEGYSEKVLARYSNFSGVDILEYRKIDGVGKWYVGDSDDSPDDLGLEVSAWISVRELLKL